MKPERPSLLTFSSSDGYVDTERYTHAMVTFLISQDDAWGWDDWPAEDDNDSD